jgi:hypothetical protein
MLIINMLMPVDIPLLHTDTRALLVLHNRGILDPRNYIASLDIIIPPTDVNQIEKETLKSGLQHIQC